MASGFYVRYLDPLGKPNRCMESAWESKDSTRAWELQAASTVIVGEYYIYINIYIYVIHIYTYIHIICMYICTFIRTHVYMCVHVYRCTHRHVQTLGIRATSRYIYMYRCWG